MKASKAHLILSVSVLLLAFPAFANAEVFIVPANGSTTTATTSKKTDDNLFSSTTIGKITREEDTLANLTKILNDSLAVVLKKISLLKKEGADVSVAAKHAGNAKVLLDGALSAILSTKPDSSLSATATPAMLRTARDEKRKTIKANLVIAHNDILKAIQALKKSIVTKKRALIVEEYDLVETVSPSEDTATSSDSE